MKKITLLYLAALIANPAFAATVSGSLAGGGGIDDMHLEIKTKSGQTITAYCQSKCGPWFSSPDENEVVELKKDLRGKKVVLDYVTEPNRDRVAGPAFEERINFIKSLRFVL